MEVDEWRRINYTPLGCDSQGIDTQVSRPLDWILWSSSLSGILHKKCIPFPHVDAASTSATLSPGALITTRAELFSFITTSPRISDYPPLSLASTSSVLLLYTSLRSLARYSLSHRDSLNFQDGLRHIKINVFDPLP